MVSDSPWNNVLVRTLETVQKGHASPYLLYSSSHKEVQGLSEVFLVSVCWVCMLSWLLGWKSKQLTQAVNPLLRT